LFHAEQEIIFDFFKKANHEILHARDLIKQFLVNNKHEDLMKTLNEVVQVMDDKTNASTKEEHSEWFVGIEGLKSKTKEEVMKMKARDRIKGYFYKTKDELTKSNIYRTSIKGREIIDHFLNDLFLFLNAVNYFEVLFDRSHEKRHQTTAKNENDETDARAFVKRRRIDADTKIKIRETSIFDDVLVTLCNKAGFFNCQGFWSANKCEYDHKINPYASRESLILFQTFNLDHQIEISRSIFPSILKNVESLCAKEDVLCESHNLPCISISTLSYFLEIFTVKNLKLVNIICHDKASHESKKSAGRLLCKNCKEEKILRKIKSKIS
jgi:DNA fragmentation factor beta subunit